MPKPGSYVFAQSNRVTPTAEIKFPGHCYHAADAPLTNYVAVKSSHFCVFTFKVCTVTVRGCNGNYQAVCSLCHPVTSKRGQCAGKGDVRMCKIISPQSIITASSVATLLRLSTSYRFLGVFEPFGLWLLFVYDVQRINPTHARHGSIDRQLIGSLDQ